MDFGQRVSMHRGTIGAGGWWWYVGAACALSGGIGTARGLGALAAGNADALLRGPFALVLGLAILVLPVLRWKQCVEVYERGFVWTRLLGTTQVPREQVQSAGYTRHLSRSGSRDEVTVELSTGKRLSIVGVEAPEQLRNFLSAWSQGSGSQPLEQPATAWSSPPVTPQAGWSQGGWKPPGA